MSPFRASPHARFAGEAAVLPCVHRGLPPFSPQPDGGGAPLGAERSLRAGRWGWLPGSRRVLSGRPLPGLSQVRIGRTGSHRPSLKGSLCPPLRPPALETGSPAPHKTSSGALSSFTASLVFSLTKDQVAPILNLCPFIGPRSRLCFQMLGLPGREPGCKFWGAWGTVGEAGSVVSAAQLGGPEGCSDPRRTVCRGQPSPGRRLPRP